MSRQVPIYVREHASGWFTVQVLRNPAYTAYGPKPSELRDSLAEAVGEDLALGRLQLPEEKLGHFTHKTLSLVLKAIQHGSLVSVPMRFMVSWRSTKDSFHVDIPRLEQYFVIRSEDDILPWAEELIRGVLHMQDVGAVLAHQYDISEKIELLEVAPISVSRLRTEKKKQQQQTLPPAHPLARFGLNLVEEADAGRLGRAQHRAAEVSQIEWAVARPRQQAFLLVGPPGVGKTAIIHELAHELGGSGTQLWQIAAVQIIAGAKYLGEWQQRAQEIIELIQANRDIWYVGHLLELMHLGGGKSGLTVAKYLAPLLEAGELMLVAEATPDAVAVAERMDPAFLRLFQRISVDPLPDNTILEILQGAAKRFEKSYRVNFAPGLIKDILDVVGRRGGWGALPRAGLELMEQAARLGSEDASKGKKALVERRLVIRAFTRQSGFPEALVDPEARLDPTELRAYFAQKVVGQTIASERLAEVILLLKAGLNDPQKPLGSFLLMGPTGVGKTESALALTEYLFGDKKRLVRFDMSEYAYPGSAIRFVDGPGGQGELTRKVREQPFGVLLFDEVEKADPGVFDILLQVLGEGRLTDGTGRTVSFTQTIVIMTSNLGTKVERPVGFAPLQNDETHRRHYLDAAEKFFRPELVNRIDHVVPFGPLTADALTLIAQRLLERALERDGLVRRGLKVVWDPSVLALVIERGYDPRYGARPMKRAVDEQVMVPLARLLAQRDGDTQAQIRVQDGQLSVIFDV